MGCVVFFSPPIKTLSGISMERVPQVVDKAEAERQEAATEGHVRVGRRKGGDGGKKTG